MTARKVALGLTICLMAAAATCGEVIAEREAVAKFANESLGIKLSDYPFGTPLDNRFSPADGVHFMLEPPIETDPSVKWYQNATSTNYARIFPDRYLIFGFKDDRLTAIRISLTDVGIPLPNGREAAKADLLKVQDAYYAMSRAARAANNATREEKSTVAGEPRATAERFRVQYNAMCSPTVESLFTSTIQITPVKQ